MHRDLKLENLLLAAPNDISCVKIAGALPFLQNLQRANGFHWQLFRSLCGLGVRAPSLHCPGSIG